MKTKLIKILALITLFIFVFSGCESNVIDDSNNEPELSSEEITEEPTEPPTEPETILPEELSTESPIIPKKVEGNMIAGYLAFEGAKTYYSFTAHVSGVYRFDFDINNVNYNYRFIVYTSKEEEICNENYDNYEHGVSLSLEENEEYKILVEQVTDCPEYTIKIGVPNETKIINGNEFSGCISFIDKQDHYYYTPSVSGSYRFDFDINNVNYNYKFEIYGEKSEEIAYAYYDDYGITCDLEADKEYTIFVKQIDGLPEYKIKIGIPKKIKRINDGVFVGKIKYIGQIDRYICKLDSGDYILSFDKIDNDSEIEVKITSPKHAEILNATPTYEELTFSITEKGDYNIYIYQRNGFTNYKILIYK